MKCLAPAAREKIAGGTAKIFVLKPRHAARQSRSIDVRVANVSALTAISDSRWHIQGLETLNGAGVSLSALGGKHTHYTFLI